MYTMLIDGGVNCIKIPSLQKFICKLSILKLFWKSKGTESSKENFEEKQKKNDLAYQTRIKVYC